ncbi:hypothetical protein NXC14_CH03386 [Rhizobium sp. NXC14]|uniref:hypothetical protein n=1 Tax=Rhizobium sp. NXC14 TaxID=1981173 RepID=UPI000A2045CC|nr:hypothetical protein [Rhizobium sp. NXC14]ARO31290.1 hypothetical protein NXC14_CH03386 [Rhizobium sp. NXC14]
MKNAKPTILDLIRRARLVRRAFRIDTSAEISENTAEFHERLWPLRSLKPEDDGYFLDIFTPDPFETDPDEIKRQYALETMTLVWFKLQTPDFDEAKMRENAAAYERGVRLTSAEREAHRKRARADAEGLKRDGLLPSERRQYESLSSFEKNRFNFPISTETLEHNAHLTRAKRARFFKDYDEGLLEGGDPNHTQLVRYRTRWRRDHVVSACAMVEDIADWIDAQMALPRNRRDKDLDMLQRRYARDELPETRSVIVTRRESAWLAVAATTAEQVASGSAKHEARPQVAMSALAAFGKYELAKDRAMKSKIWSSAGSRKSRNLLISRFL